MCGSEGDDGDGRHDEEKEREGGWWKERWKKRGGWWPGVGSRGRVVEAGANEPFFTPVDRWVVERGLPRLLSVSRTSGLQHPRFFPPFVRPLSSFLRPRFPFVSPFLFGPSLSLLSCSALDSRNPFISRSRFRGSVPFFPPFRPICSPSRFLPSPPPPPFADLIPVSPPFTRALFRLLLRSVPTACVSTAKSIDRNVFRSGRNERECNRREWGGI